MVEGVAHMALFDSRTGSSKRCVTTPTPRKVALGAVPSEVNHRKAYARAWPLQWHSVCDIYRIQVKDFVLTLKSYFSHLSVLPLWHALRRTEAV